jgi:prophage antirepressor-like protein
MAMTDSHYGHGNIRTVDWDGETWVNLSDMEDLVEASQDRWDIEGSADNARCMRKFAETLRNVLG